VITAFTLLVGILLALLLPGGGIVLYVWLKTKQAEKQRILLEKSKKELLRVKEKFHKEQFLYMRSKWRNKNKK